MHLDSASFPDFISIPLPSYNLFRYLHTRIIVRRTDAAIERERSKLMEPFAEDLLAWEVPADAATAPEREEPPKEDARAAGAGINAVRMANKDAGALRANLNPGAARAKSGNPAPLNLGAARGMLENRKASTTTAGNTTERGRNAAHCTFCNGTGWKGFSKCTFCNGVTQAAEKAAAEKAAAEKAAAGKAAAERVSFSAAGTKTNSY